MSALNLITASSVEPVTLEEAKSHLRVNIDDDDALIQSHLEAARERVELVTGLQLIQATWELWLNSFPGMRSGYDPGASSGSGVFGVTAGLNAWMDWTTWQTRRFIDMPKAPLVSVSSITYVDGAGALQTWDPTQYQVHAPASPIPTRGRIQPAFGISWPVTRDQLDAVIVRFVAGFGAAGAAVPQMLRRAILLIAGDLYENREATVVTERRVTVQELPYGVDQILQQYRARPVLRAA